MLRSMLFTPANHSRRVEKALTQGAADAAILDLEDAVAIPEKVPTRTLVAAVLPAPRRAKAYVRVNGVDTPWFFGDLDGVVWPGLDGVMLPKTGSAQMLYLADKYLSHLERERGLSPDGIDLLPLIETGEGMANLREICGCHLARVHQVSFGSGDFSIDLGLTLTASEQELLVMRTYMVVYSRTGGLEPPIDTIYGHIHDEEGFEASCRRGRQLGFQGRLCIHPDQVEPANRIYLPGAEEIAWAEEVVAAFTAAEAQGVASIQVRGQLVDYANARQAQRLLQRLAPPGA